jgi:hypothetical protein
LRSRWLALAAAVVLVAGLWWLREPAAPSPTAPDSASPMASAPGAAAPAAATALPVVVLSLSPVAVSGSSTPPSAEVPRGTAQVRFALGGALPADGELTAEIAATDRDEVKRWPVDVDHGGGPGRAVHTVTVPVYAVPAGGYSLTVWAGDAEVVQRYAFRIVGR